MKQPGFHGMSRMSHFECCELTLKPPTGASTSCDLKKWEKIGAILSAEQLKVWRLFWRHLRSWISLTVTPSPWPPWPRISQDHQKDAAIPFENQSVPKVARKKHPVPTRVVLVVVMLFHLDWPSSLQITCGKNSLGVQFWHFSGWLGVSCVFRCQLNR